MVAENGLADHVLNPRVYCFIHFVDLAHVSLSGEFLGLPFSIVALDSIYGRQRGGN